MRNKDYEEYASKKYDELIESQEAFNSKFKLESYSNWFYDQESELLRVYNDDDDEIFFKYIPIGTYSLKSNTWLWSWENEHSIEKNKLKTLVVKQLGEKRDYEKLTKGLIDCDREECWDFVAISKSMINAIGVYCTNSKDLLTYKLLTKVFTDKDSSLIRMMKQKTVDCGNHGFRRPAFVCKHLNHKEKLGFEEAFDTHKGMDLDDEDSFAAWCDECEQVRLETDGWNEESEKFADIKLVCEECYFELKEFNKK
ncbi:DUF6882 domain-containing protein [Snuella sedimenti]|uniref:Uncharacterized protein n=1 Tax=Snuella sedimenti TaxID=2798802 RepID=A0A8J7LXI5_9FLAO|nr:DUF6882 domain-containing protein [Snuella sedimenti]MBJ6366806.1 hypothetical protein [Snuella sedimenti]